MANPNLFNLTSVQGRVTGSTLTDVTTTALLTTPSDHLYKITNITVTNITTPGVASVTLFVYDSSTTTAVKLISTLEIPANTSVNISDKNSLIYLEEGDELRGGTASANTADIIISYEDMQ